MGNSWFIITIPTIDVSEVQLPNYKCVYSTRYNALDAIEIRIESLLVCQEIQIKFCQDKTYSDAS